MAHTSANKIKTADLILEALAINFVDFREKRLCRTSFQECVFTAKRRIKHLLLKPDDRKIYLGKIENLFIQSTKLDLQRSA